MRRVVIVSLIALSGALAVARADDPVPEPAPPEAHEVLANGLEVVVLPSKRAHACSVLTAFRAGARSEDAGEAGVAQLAIRLRRLAACGTREPNAADREIAALGPKNDAGTATGADSVHELSYTWAVVPEDKIGAVLDIERERFVSLRPEKAGLEDVRSALLAEPLKRETRAWNALLALAFPSSGLGRSRLGTPETVSTLGLDAVLAWGKGHLRVDDAVLVIAGARDAKAALELVRAKLGTIPRPDQPPAAAPAIPAAPKGPVRAAIDGPATARHVWLAFRGPAPGGDDEAAFLAATFALKDRVVDALQGKAHEATVRVDARSDCPALLVVSVTPRPSVPLLDVEARARGAANLVRTQPPADMERLRARVARMLDACTSPLDKDLEGAKDEPGALVDAAVDRALAGPLVARRDALKKSLAALGSDAFVAKAKELLSEERLSIATIEPAGK